MKLRKHLRTKRIESIRQVGIDRVIDIQFGTGTHAYHILVEFYAKGNIILTDHEYIILNLLRKHEYDDENKCAVKEKYPFSAAAGGSIDNIVTDVDKVKAFVTQAKNQAAEGGSKKKKRSKKGGKGTGAAVL